MAIKINSNNKNQSCRAGKINAQVLKIVRSWTKKKNRDWDRWVTRRWFTWTLFNTLSSPHAHNTKAPLIVACKFIVSPRKSRWQTFYFYWVSAWKLTLPHTHTHARNYTHTLATALNPLVSTSCGTSPSPSPFHIYNLHSQSQSASWRHLIAFVFGPETGIAALQVAYKRVQLGRKGCNRAPKVVVLRKPFR